MSSPSSRRRVAVALSGGVDSAVTAALLHAEGFDVIALTMDLGPASAGAVRDARRICDHLGLEHHVLNLAARFQESVVGPFADSYAEGQTPLPCAVCNREVKFGTLLEAARDKGADLLATGHYVRLSDGPEGPCLRRALDTHRDQSYFLFALPRAVLGSLRFPLGAMPGKDETRALAGRLGLPVERKPDSQDLCFCPQGDHASLVARLRPDASQPGPIVDTTGRVLGEHRGLIHHTVGQRRGLGLGGGPPLYVVALEPEGRRVVVGPREALACRSFGLRALNWLGPGPGPALNGTPVRVKIRNAAPPVAATVHPLPAGSAGGLDARVDLETPAFGVAPGQAAVFYGPDEDTGAWMMGGGWITPPAGPLPTPAAPA
nr:tRNA 2-thiouridine(34) synthase MnmA [Pararhodospirillum oryzae]